MTVLSLFANTSSRELRATGTQSGQRGRGYDVGRMSRERRLAFYRGACKVLGLNPADHHLKFVRCDDGRLRLADPTRVREPLARLDRIDGLLPRLERELNAAAVAIATGGGISYEIELETGDLRVIGVVMSPRYATVATPRVDAYRRPGANRKLSSMRGERP